MLLKVPYGSRVPDHQPPKCSEAEAWGFLCAGMALQPEKEYNEASCEAMIPLPDEEAHRTLMWEALTDEARFVVELLRDTPVEAIGFLYSPAQTKLQRWGLYSYLRKVVGWGAPTVRQVFGELEEYVEVL